MQANALPSELPEKTLTSTLCQSLHWTPEHETGLFAKSPQSQRRVKLANKSQDNVIRAQEWRAENQDDDCNLRCQKLHGLGCENSSLGKEVRERGFHGVEADYIGVRHKGRTISSPAERNAGSESIQ